MINEYINVQADVSASPNKNAERKCRRKRCYDTKSSALGAARDFFNNNKRTVRPYACDVCGNFHNTSAFGAGHKAGE